MSNTEHALAGNFSFVLPTRTTMILDAELGLRSYTSSDTSGVIAGMGTMSGRQMSGATQLAVSMRAGQPIFERTGLSLSAKYQWNLRKGSRTLSLNNGLISDDELFDDHYAYEGLQTSLMVTQVVDESMILRLTGGLQSRLYSSLPAYDVEGYQIADHRTDTRSYLSFTLQKTFDSGFVLGASYDLIRNVSNDPFYTYQNNAISLNFTIPF
jgi:hypothetical protein